MLLHLLRNPLECLAQLGGQGLPWTMVDHPNLLGPRALAETDMRDLMNRQDYHSAISGTTILADATTIGLPAHLHPVPSVDEKDTVLATGLLNGMTGGTEDVLDHRIPGLGDTEALAQEVATTIAIPISLSQDGLLERCQMFRSSS